MSVLGWDLPGTAGARSPVTWKSIVVHDRLRAIHRSQGAPGRHADVVRDGANGAVAEPDVDAIGVTAIGRDHIAIGVKGARLLVGRIDVVVDRRVTATPQPRRADRGMALPL